MKSAYDMCVGYDAICDLEDKLKKVNFDLENSMGQMLNALKTSNEFLSGDQYKKACDTTSRSLDLAIRTRDNIEEAQKYLFQIREKIIEYEKCTYEGDL